jgi:PAS domain S-box-containing protein
MFQRKDGTTFPVLIKSEPVLKGGNVTGVRGIVMDISRLKNTEEALMESQGRYEAMFIHNPEAAAYVGPDMRVKDVNPRFEELFGYSLADIKGKIIDETIIPEGKQEEAAAISRDASKGCVFKDTTRKRKDGSIIHVSVSATSTRSNEQISGYIVTYHDISELRKTERKLEILNEKLHVVGGLTRHDARNKLATLRGKIFLAKRKLDGNEEIAKLLKEAENNSSQIVDIFDFAANYEKLGAEELKSQNVFDQLNEAASQINEMHSVKLMNECQGLTLQADSLLKRLFYNLIDNSLKHGEKTSIIRVHYEKTNQEIIRLHYEDDGVGIPLVSKQMLFKEGFSTGGSTGHGLFLIKRIVEFYGWTVEETGEPGEGVHFILSIPKFDKNAKENYHISNAS